MSTAVIEETDTVARALVRDAGGEVRAVRTGSTDDPLHYLHTDGQGSITGVTGASPSSLLPGLAMLCTARFDAHGSPISPRSGSNPCRSGSTSFDHFYRGERRDAATGNYQRGSRTYNPTRGSFLTPDTYRTRRRPQR